MEDKTISVTEASKILGVARKTVYEWIESGKIECVTQVTKSGKEKKIPLSKSVYAIASDQKPSEPEPEVERDKESGPPAKAGATEDPDDKPKVKVDNREDLIILSKHKAETLLRQEQAWEKRQQNLVKEKSLVDSDELKLAFIETMSTAWESIREAIDKVGIEENLPERVTKKYHNAFNNSLRKVEKKISGKFETKASVFFCAALLSHSEFQNIVLYLSSLSMGLI